MLGSSLDDETATDGSQDSDTFRLLVVDDDLVVRLVSRVALEKAGFSVTEASDGYTALSWLGSHRFDAIILDARMPGMDGFSTCRKMREFLEDDPVPIIIATGQDDDASIDAAFECGATDFVAKPLNWKIISQRLNSLIRARNIKKHLSSRSFQISSMLKTSSEAMLVLDRDGVIQAGHQIERLPSVIGQTFSAGQCFFECLPSHCVSDAFKTWKTATPTESVNKFVLNYDLNNTSFTIQGRFIAGVENEILCLLQDHSEAFVSERRMFELAYTDTDTGIPNEKQLVSELNLRLKNDLETGRHTLVIRYSASDLSGFEPRIGRRGLTKLACAVVERLDIGLDGFMTALPRDLVGTPALIARLSDTDFVIVLSGLRTIEFAEDLAEGLARRLSSAFEVDGFSCMIDWNVGGADSFETVSSADGLLSATAYALHSEPESLGLKRVRWFNAELRNTIYKDIELERLLRRDIADGVLEMHYQPKFDLSGLELIGVEALIRWTNTELGFVSPAKFIPIAEQAGLIVPLTHLVTERVFDQMVAWREEGRKEVPISINISGIHLSTRTIVEELRAGIQQRNIKPELVELEVTESIMVDGVSKALQNLNDLRELGIRVAIDDFGTGYSSLSYLRKLPIDCLKIDRSFVSSVNSDPTAQAIARAITTVGHDVGLHVIAEGVETAEQFEFLKQIGCDSVQGYFTGRPVPSKDFATFFDGAQLDQWELKNPAFG
ncbi:EAL domain-containing protein [Marinobacter sp. F3R08]|uniref:two-component system response regulator n=1 Tax=Marinobacter sp. F3R08 TaxID=2841559 RepID=UPI001C09568E|nr:EAL domain-containing protein [Marinobacter sp. F3R08]MBU2955891.1 EAL domain-containing protein [Marinobacter sp. F3R08]